MRQDRLSRWARRVLPAGRALPGEMWNRRHRGIVIAVWCHVPALLLFGVLTHHNLLHSLTDVAPVIVLGALASRPCFSRLVRSSLATLGLVTCSALAVHFSHGNIEMHFHFFVVVGVITLYQEWVPFGVALVFVVFHHGLLGVVAPGSVYDHKSAVQDPWLWAAIHGAFVLAASVPHILAWRLNEDQALRDPLTRLPNRTLFGDRLAHALARRDRYGDEPAVLFVDLDRFKQVNDTLGHTMGDQLLIAAAARLESAIRQTDTAARFGGDEFAILLEGRGAAAPEKTADRLLRALREPVTLGDREIFLNASIGIALATGDTTVEDVLRNADLAMYMAKASGRGRYEQFDQSMHERAVEHMELEDDLRRALDGEGITVEYQPTIALGSGRVVGVEALARWHHPTRGTIPPGVFIPIAERAGLIGRLGLHVLADACHTAVQLHEIDPTLDMSVNLSPHQLADPGLALAVARVLEETHLDASRLVLEITENVLMDDVNLTTKRLTELKALGVRIAIDDFGTGYSSLSYLRHFPVDILKIDRSFVETLPGSGTELARTILRLGETLHLEVVAEGIETPPQLAELNELGCSHGQGFLFARPLPVDEVQDLILNAAAGGLLPDALAKRG